MKMKVKVKKPHSDHLKYQLYESGNEMKVKVKKPYSDHLKYVL